MNDVTIIGDMEEKLTDTINQDHYFSCGVYTLRKPEFLTTVRKISKKYLAKTKLNIKIDKIYPVVITENMFQEPELEEFITYVKNTAHHILTLQGYNMDLYEIIMYEIWCQEHFQFSGQEEHIHQATISGFYFLDCPEDCPRAVFHDPRPVKVYSNLQEYNPSQATYGSVAINYLPEPGLMMFSNSWLPHSFLKNPSKKPFRFIHFNLGVNYKPVHTIDKDNTCLPQSSII